jgi:hypothetical protein
MRIRKSLAAVIGGAAVLTAAVGCGSAWDQQHNHNTPVGPYLAPDNVVIEFPNNFDNVARACANGDGVYMPFGGKTAFVVPNDPACAGK